MVSVVERIKSKYSSLSRKSKYVIGFLVIQKALKILLIVYFFTQ